MPEMKVFLCTANYAYVVVAPDPTTADQMVYFETKANVYHPYAWYRRGPNHNTYCDGIEEIDLSQPRIYQADV